VDYQYILRQVWQISRRWKMLWLLGILSTLSARLRLRPQIRNLARIAEWLPPEMRDRFAGFASGPYTTPALVGSVLLALLVGVGLALLHAAARAALTDQVNRIENGDTPALRAAWEVGKRHVWRVLAISVLLGLPVLALVAAGLIPLLLGAFVLDLPAGLERNTVAASMVLCCLFPALFLGLLLAIPLSVLRRLAVRACVLENQAIRQSIVRAWGVLRSNLGAVVLLWLILAAVALGAILLVGAPCLLVTGLSSPLVDLFSRSSPAGLAGVCGAALLFWLLETVITGAVETLFSTAWTLAYRDVAGLGLTGQEADWA
jgi:hypothetical protein